MFLGKGSWLAVAGAILVTALFLPGRSAPAKVDFETEVLPILKTSCGSCHGEKDAAAGLRLDTQAEIAKAQDLYVAGKSSESPLYTRLVHENPKKRMPLSQPAMPADKIAVIKNWIDEGASFGRQKVSYAKDIAPIFKANCSMCHAGSSPKGSLNLFDEKAITKGGDSGAVIKAGDPENSLLVRRILGLDGLPQMPKGYLPLKPAQIEMIKLWIKSGAKFDGEVEVHWAYVTPKVPPVPPVKGPVKNPIDNFILARLEREGLSPSKEASKETLLRRLSLDITGLPPTVKEIDAFLADQSPNAYEKQVDRLLASPHYGERMARVRLDLSRYGDTNGYEKDLSRTAYKFRDYLIDSFNNDKPFAQFTKEMIAGDLLSNATMEQLVATGFNRNTLLNDEGGVDPAEAHFNVTIDRVQTVGTVWLGSTIGCARCHDHKYDPISQKDFYSLYAYFNNTELNKGTVWTEPNIRVASPEQEAKLKAVQAEIARYENELKNPPATLLTDFGKWRDSKSIPTWNPVRFDNLKGVSGTELTQNPNGVIAAGKVSPEKDTYVLSGRLGAGTHSGLKLDALKDKALVNGGPGRATSGNFVLTGVVVKLDGKPVKLQIGSASFTQGGYDINSVIRRDVTNGWAVAGGYNQDQTAIFQFEKPISGPGVLEVSLEFQSVWPQHTFGQFTISTTNSTSPLLTPLSQAEKQMVASGDQDKLKEFYIGRSDFGVQLNAKLTGSRQQLDRLNSMIPTAQIIREAKGDQIPSAPVYHRGEFLSPEGKVTAGTPKVLPAPIRNGKPNRLELANWLVDKRNPLTWRVQANRFWEIIFGTGIVETAEDFGTQGSRPTHQDLLDWLACNYRDTGGSAKAMMKLIVMSATYRQDSSATKVALEKDPGNRLLSHGPRFRLEAEAIRDNALKIGGLLSEKIGGPSVFPVQPTGIWDSPYSGETWNQSMGEDVYRRGIYTFIKRTALYPMYSAFDATSRETCTARRIRTNTPLQALNLMNDPVMLEAAKGLAKQMLSAGTSPDQRLVYGFRTATGRKPDATELTRLKSFLNKMKTRYALDEAGAKKLGGSVESAAYFMTASVILNLDETITKE